MKPFQLFNHPDTEYNMSQPCCNQTMVYSSYPYGDPNFAYAPQAINEPQLMPQMLLAPARVPLPLDLTEDGPIYVNAKQYHGILRRRQSRAKLEAQNKLIKSRKPYLHESRHRHALNRVRGSGGRFLSTKKNSESNAEYVPGEHSTSDPVNMYQKEDPSELESHLMMTPDDACLPGDDIDFRQPELMFMGNSPNMAGAPQCSGGSHTLGGTKQRASIVR